MGRLTLGKHTSTGKLSPFGHGTANDRLMKASVALQNLEQTQHEFTQLSLRMQAVQQQNDNTEAALEDARTLSTNQKHQLERLEHVLKESRASQLESERENREQYQARASLEKEKLQLEASHATLVATFQSVKEDLTQSTADLLEHTETHQLTLIGLETENEALKSRMATTLQPLEAQCKEAVQMQQQAEAELHTTKNMMQRYQKESQVKQPLIDKLQSKVDKYKMEKKVLVKAVVCILYFSTFQ